MRRSGLAAKMKRRLVAIFSADVANYSGLMHLDEGGTLRQLEAHRAIADRLITQHGGRIANTAGDSILAEFASTIDAFRCSINILERMSELNLEVPEERRVRFRIGLHVDEVSIKGGDLFGDGVNIAARLQGLALPGAICISQSAHQFIYRVVPATYDDLGPQPLKNLGEPIRAYLARPSDPSATPVVPAVHRRADAHLARRFHSLCNEALLNVTRRRQLEPVEFAAIASFHDAPGMDPRRLPARLGIPPALAEQIVKRLARRRLIRPARNHDAGLMLTSAGLKILQDLRPRIAAAQDSLLAPLSDRERQTLHQLLLRVINAAGLRDRSRA